MLHQEKPITVRGAKLSGTELTAQKLHPAADLFVSRFGGQAPREALIRAEELRAAGDVDGYAFWLRMHERVNEILKRTGRHD